MRHGLLYEYGIFKQSIQNALGRIFAQEHSSEFVYESGVIVRSHEHACLKAQRWIGNRLLPPQRVCACHKRMAEIGVNCIAATEVSNRLCYLHPAAKAVGVMIGGWHDFRHNLVQKMRRGGVHPVVVSAVVGHKSVELAPEVYDRANQNEIRAALGVVGKKLLPNLLPSAVSNC